MTRVVLFLALVACGSSSKPAETAPPPPARVEPPAIVPAECEGAGTRVVYDGKNATVTKNDVSLGTASCAMTAMAVYSVVCRGSTFAFLYAGIPGTPAIGGKSAQLDVGGATEMMDCHAPAAQRAQSVMGPPLDPCQCAADEHCVPSPVSRGSYVCVRNDRPPPVQ